MEMLPLSTIKIYNWVIIFFTPHVGECFLEAKPSKKYPFLVREGLYPIFDKYPPSTKLIQFLHRHLSTKYSAGE